MSPTPTTTVTTVTDVILAGSRKASHDTGPGVTDALSPTLRQRELGHIRYTPIALVGRSMTPESMFTPEERERRIALVRFNNTCARCTAVAWSRSLEAAMQLCPKRGNPEKRELVCGGCCAKLDAKKSRRGRAA